MTTDPTVTPAPASIDPPLFHLKVDAFITRLTSRGMADNTARAYKADLVQYGRWVEDNLRISGAIRPIVQVAWDEDHPLCIPRYLNAYRSFWAASTCKRKVAAFRAFQDFNGATCDALTEYKAPRVPPGVAHPLPGGIADILKMVHATRNPRHRALVVLIGLLGLRCSEALTVRCTDLSDDTGHIVLTVRGKGDKTRHLPVDDRVMELLDEPYCRAVDDHEAGGAGLLCPLSDRAARRAWTRIGARAGITRPTATHDGRMTFGTAAYDNDKDLRAVQELLGHSSAQTTETYTSVTFDKMRKAGAVL